MESNKFNNNTFLWHSTHTRIFISALVDTSIWIKKLYWLSFKNDCFCLLYFYFLKNFYCIRFFTHANFNQNQSLFSIQQHLFTPRFRFLYYFLIDFDVFLVTLIDMKFSWNSPSSKSSRFLVKKGSHLFQD